MIKLMSKVSFISPLDQPVGTSRLLDVLRNGLEDDRFTRLRIIVAYAKSGPILRLEPEFQQWKKEGKQICAIFGVDQQGTSLEALTLALNLFDNLYVTREKMITFHPKVYIFEGKSDARIIVGSNNLTVGGTETNFETSVLLDLLLPDDNALFNQVDTFWEELLPNSCAATAILDDAYLSDLVSDEIVISEKRMQRESNASKKSIRAPKSGLRLRPPSPLPKSIFKPQPSKKKASTNSSAQSGAGNANLPPSTSKPISGLAIQIKPHGNGEIFLSKIAVSQNPNFFGFPFTGKTTPKKPTNPAYPQRDPDPVVDIEVYGAAQSPLLILQGYRLNTVYYSSKSEIRITASPLVSVVPEYSVMVIVVGQSKGIDYEIQIYRPDSPDYQAWLGICNQTMPSGGKAPRKFGWF